MNEALSKTSPDAEKSTLSPSSHLGRRLIFIAYAVFITTLAQDKVLGSLPIRFLLKNDLHTTKTQLSAFLFWAGLALVYQAAVRADDRLVPPARHMSPLVFVCF